MMLICLGGTSLKRDFRNMESTGEEKDFISRTIRPPNTISMPVPINFWSTGWTEGRWPKFLLRSVGHIYVHPLQGQTHLCDDANVQKHCCSSSYSTPLQYFLSCPKPVQSCDPLVHPIVYFENCVLHPGRKMTVSIDSVQGKGLVCTLSEQNSNA